MVDFKKKILFVAAAALLAAPLLTARTGEEPKGGKLAWAVGKVHTGKIALKAGRIITMAGEEIEEGTILVSNGRIEAVGRDVKIPYDYWVIDAKDRTVTPGFVEAHTARGLDRANESLPVVPFLDVSDAVDPSSLYFEDALRDGITTLLICQGNNTVIGGMARVMRPIGMTAGEMTVLAEAGLKLSFTPMRGQDRLTQMALFRETFRELEEYVGQLAEERYEKDLKEKGETIAVTPAEARKKGMALVEDEDLDFKHRNLKRLASGRLAAFIWCGAAVDVLHAVEFARAKGFLGRAVFVLGGDSFKAAELIKKAGRCVILGPDLIYREEDPLTGEEKETFTPLVFYEAGVPFAVTTNPRGDLGTRYPWQQAARLVRNGIPREEALKAVTANPASFIGVGDRLGAIKPGFDATFLVLTGDPLDETTWVDSVFIDGKIVYERDKDYRLKELLTGKKEERGEKKAGKEKE